MLKYPAPQPNNEIRKPSIELKFTLISVTICSLIFFICNLGMQDTERACMRAQHPCGVKQVLDQLGNTICLVAFFQLFAFFMCSFQRCCQCFCFSLLLFFACTKGILAYFIKTKAKIWNASRICVSSLRRGHANLLCIVPILVYVMPKQTQFYTIMLKSL